jgi:biotin carboxyl carrier protein
VAVESGSRDVPSSSATLTPLGGGRYLLAEDGRTRLAYAAADRDRTWVFVDGRVYTVDAVPPSVQTRSRRHDAASALMAPMPATVLSVSVRPGDRVSRGDVLMTLEAMKMELPVHAPRDGTVTSVACGPGDLVQPGVPLVEIA